MLTSRIAYMIEQGVAPFNILALTFTNKAAEQMRERIAQMIPTTAAAISAWEPSTRFFAYPARERRLHRFPDSFTIYEPSDCKNLLKTIVRELNLPDEKYKPNSGFAHILCQTVW
ncbi:MAG: UvrD-helicase domain-containing protein [Alistipes finegoldii]